MGQTAAAADAPVFELGVIADAQYGDKEARNGRTYRESLGRLAASPPGRLVSSFPGRVAGFSSCRLAR